MKIRVGAAVLVIGYKREDQYIPHTCEYMQARERGELLVPFHRDECGDSTSLVVRSANWTERSPLEEQRQWVDDHSNDYAGMRKVVILRGDWLEIATACCTITGTVVTVDASTSIRLKNVEFSGPWANFGGGSTLTFGLVEYQTAGTEEVEATGFLGTLDQYRQLREAEPKGLDFSEVQRRRGLQCLLSDSVHERAEQLAETTGCISTYDRPRVLRFRPWDRQSYMRR